MVLCTIYVRISYQLGPQDSVLRHPVSYIVSAYLVSYCLLVRQQQRFHHPTLRTSTVILVACIEQSTISGKHVHCCILVHVSCFFGGLRCCPYCTYLPRVCCVIPCPILLVRTSYDTVFSCFSCDNNSVFITLHSEQHQLLWWDVSKK